MKIIFESEYERSRLEKLMDDIFKNSSPEKTKTNDLFSLCDCFADLIVWITKAETEIKHNAYTEPTANSFLALPYSEAKMNSI